MLPQNSLDTYGLRLQIGHQSSFTSFSPDSALLCATKRRKDVWIVESVDTDVASLKRS